MSKPHPVMPSNPYVILAGIKRFGLAADGSDIRDLAAVLERWQQERSDLRNQLECANGEIAKVDELIGIESDETLSDRVTRLVNLFVDVQRQLAKETSRATQWYEECTRADGRAHALREQLGKATHIMRRMVETETAGSFGAALEFLKQSDDQSNFPRLGDSQGQESRK